MHNPAQQQSKASFAFFIAFSILLFFLLTWLYTSGVSGMKKGELASPDCYMHLVRAAELYNTGQWYDAKSLRSNAPYGETLHWTKPFDCILLAGAIPLSHIIGFHSALFWWAVLLSPLMMTLTLIALHFSVRPIVSSDASYIILPVLAFQPIIFSYFQAGRPDHHSLLVLLFVISLGVNLQMLLKTFAKSWCIAAGAVASLAIWVSIESILSIGVIIAILALFWILGNPDFAKKSFFYSITLFVGTAISLLTEKPFNNLTSVEYDSLSIVYVALFALFVLFWACALAAGSTRFLLLRRSRLLFSLSGAFLAALVMFLLFPSFFKGPYADVEPKVVPIWLRHVSEVESAFTKLFFVLIPLIGSAAISFPFLLTRLLRARNLNNQKGVLYLAVLTLVFLTLSLLQIRFAMYAQTLLCIVIAEIISRILSWLGKHGRGPLIIAARLSVIIILSTGFAAAGLFLDMRRGHLDNIGKPPHLFPFCSWLNDAPQYRGKTLRILANVFLGPEILYRTDDEVIATPYHRNGRAIIDVYDVMTAETDNKARRLIDSRGITTILLCPSSSEEFFYSTDKQKSTFYTRLRAGLIPDWLSSVTLPEDLSSSFFLFEVKQPQ